MKQRGNRIAGMAMAVVAVLVIAAAPSAQAGDVITFAGYGGAYQKGIVDALAQPAARRLGLSLAQNTTPGLTAVRVQVQSGSPAWDIVNLGADECAAGSAQGLFEPLDYHVIDATGLAANTHARDWVAANYYSVVLAYRKDKYGEHPPRTWRDFWNAAQFPGRRAMSDAPIESLEIALLADGVQPDRLYPLDIDRAIRSMTKLKPAITVWWSSGAQSAQLIQSGEVDMEMIWGSRLTPVLRDNAPVSYSTAETILGMGCLAIPKGARHVAEAQKMIALMVSPGLQANIPRTLEGYGPANARAFEVGKFDAHTLAELNSSPENLAHSIQIDGRWWGAGNNQKTAAARYKALIAR
ncbi:ABC transporter substrate-binding protein [Burkholderia sp. BCC1998]|uniref:ABC transporter substrate-binding protein n=1 Tax=Burkholderia sp. BCC1998 TaxID=2817447 RepID=UPI002AB6611F|nr:ABC transporter substrate-binding protein [Burkholderia sp. BCC1998]